MAEDDPPIRPMTFGRVRWRGGRRAPQHGVQSCEPQPKALSGATHHNTCRPLNPLGEQNLGAA
jgi:hypothetical protein